MFSPLINAILRRDYEAIDRSLEYAIGPDSDSKYIDLNPNYVNFVDNNFLTPLMAACGGTAHSYDSDHEDEEAIARAEGEERADEADERVGPEQFIDQYVQTCLPAKYIAKLLELGADPNYRRENDYMSTPLIYLARSGQYPEQFERVNKNIALLLNNMSTRVDLADENGRTVCHHLAACNNAAGIELVLQSAPQLINMRTKSEWTPLMIAANESALDAIDVLVKYGADVMVRGLVHVAHPDCLAKILQYGARVDQQFDMYNPLLPLHYHCQHLTAEPNVIDLLLAHGAKINQDCQSVTPLHILVQYSLGVSIPHFLDDTIRHLLRRGADPFTASLRHPIVRAHQIYHYVCTIGPILQRLALWDVRNWRTILSYSHPVEIE